MWGKNLIMCIRNTKTEALQKLCFNEATYENHRPDLLTMKHKRNQGCLFFTGQVGLCTLQMYSKTHASSSDIIITFVQFLLAKIKIVQQVPAKFQSIESVNLSASEFYI
jgi:hypothetical protein